MTTLTDAELSELDVIFLVDASGSMGSPSNRFQGKNRWEECQEFVESLARYVERIDSDGIDVGFFGSKVELTENVTSQRVSEIFKSTSPYGSTPLARGLDLAVKKHLRSGKKTVIIVATDGEPDSRDEVSKIIVNATKATVNEGINFGFIQIGDDPSASKFLQSLDDDLTSKGAAYDAVDVIPTSSAENMSPGELIWKIMND